MQRGLGAYDILFFEHSASCTGVLASEFVELYT